jgi:hypothetical protein
VFVVEEAGRAHLRRTEARVVRTAFFLDFRSFERISSTCAGDINEEGTMAHVQVQIRLQEKEIERSTYLLVVLEENDGHGVRGEHVGDELQRQLPMDVVLRP